MIAIFVINIASMIKSMTGYGKASCILAGKKITVEIKSLNGKQADIYMRLPQIYKEKEIEIRSLVISLLERGKIDLYLTIEETGGENAVNINKTLVKNYFREIKSLYEETGISMPEETLLHILKFPDVLTGNENIQNEELELLKNTVSVACTLVDEFRKNEGRTLNNDLLQRIGLIVNMMSGIDPFEKERLGYIKNKLRNDLQEIADRVSVDENRFEQELIFYIDKIDFTEEKTRLKNHCDYFITTMEEGTANGKKLGFIAQEMGREINTLGSKANHSSIQQIVVQMKDELEKIKEQLLNIL